MGWSARRTPAPQPDKDGMEEKRRPTITLILSLLILALAARVRFFRLDAQSFWHDEGNSVRIAERSIKLIIEGAAGAYY